MKKKLITIIIGMVFCIGWIGGCASKETNHDNVATSVTEESKQEGVKKEKEPEQHEVFRLSGYRGKGI